MVGTLWTVILDFCFGIISNIMGLFLKPIGDLIFNYAFGIDNWLEYTDTYLNAYFYPGIRFALGVVCNITGLPYQFFMVIATILFFFYLLFIGSLVVRFVFNAWGWFKTGKAVEKASSGK